MLFVSWSVFYTAYDCPLLYYYADRLQMLSYPLQVELLALERILDLAITIP